MIDALLPREMADRAEHIGVQKAALDVWPLLALSVLAGAFIALGAVFAATVATGPLPFGVSRLLTGLVFSVGLILVVVGGAELFTGNSLLIMAWVGGKIPFRLVARNWVITYLGNFLGAVGTVALVFMGGHHLLGHGQVGATVLALSEAKCHLGFPQAIALGILCNAMVCMAVWLSYSARTTTDKVLVILLPISGFVAAGFEHSVANMYFLPAGLLIKTWGSPEFWTSIGGSAADYPSLTWPKILFDNLLPVTIGNLIGGVVLVGLVYWFIYLRTGPTPLPPIDSLNVPADLKNP